MALDDLLSCLESLLMAGPIVRDDDIKLYKNNNNSNLDFCLLPWLVGVAFAVLFY